MSHIAYVAVLHHASGTFRGDKEIHRTPVCEQLVHEMIVEDFLLAAPVAVHKLCVLPAAGSVAGARTAMDWFGAQFLPAIDDVWCEIFACTNASTGVAWDDRVALSPLQSMFTFEAA